LYSGRLIIFTITTVFHFVDDIILRDQDALLQAGTAHESKNEFVMKYKHVAGIIGLGAALFVPACSTETAKRTTFETLQNLRQQECRNNGDADCQKRESYDEYQHMKQEEKKTQE